MNIEYRHDPRRQKSDKDNDISIEVINYNNYDKRLDVENAKVYSKYEFFKACQDMGIIKDLKAKNGEISTNT